MRTVEIIEISSDEDEGSVPLPIPTANQVELWNEEATASNESRPPRLQTDGLSRHENQSQDGALSLVTTQLTMAPFTEADCLQKVLEVFPDICRQHVLSEYRAGIAQGLPGAYWCDELIAQFLDSGPYPKESERRQELKRKRTESKEEDGDAPDWDVADRDDSEYFQHAQALLAQEFREVPVGFIRDTLKTERYLFQAYSTIEAIERTYHSTQEPPYRKVKRGAKKVPTDSQSNMPRIRSMKNLLREFDAAKKRRDRDEARRRNTAERALFEPAKVPSAPKDTPKVECGCCFDEFPLDELIYCNGAVAHFFCYSCARSNVNAAIGQSQCRPKCMDTGGCGAEFIREQLQLCLDNKTYEKLEKMQQEEDIRLAGLDDLVECPFCDYKAICPPVEVDREFRCSNPDCQKVSCRLCKAETHIPLTCEAFAKENKMSVRHVIEEAMTEALVRTCNRCKNKFIKEEGCNKMTCPRCRNVQCYICGKDSSDYGHFRPGKCDLYDNTAARHIDEVKRAEQRALERVKAENPDMDEEDLKVKVSDAVKKEESRRVQNGNRRGGWGHGVMDHPPIGPARLGMGVMDGQLPAPMPAPMPYGPPIPGMAHPNFPNLPNLPNHRHPPVLPLAQYVPGVPQNWGNGPHADAQIPAFPGNANPYLQGLGLQNPGMQPHRHLPYLYMMNMNLADPAAPIHHGGGPPQQGPVLPHLNGIDAERRRRPGGPVQFQPILRDAVAAGGQKLDKGGRHRDGRHP